MPITTSIENKVAHIVISRPQTRNTLDADMCSELANQLLACDKDEQVRAILISGESNIFSAGLDIEQLMSTPGAILMAFEKVISALDSAEKPIVAAVAGPAVAQGAAMLYHCDLVYCSEHALFSLPNIALGLSPQYGASYFSVKSGGYKQAAQKILMSEPISPSEAIIIGLVSRVVPDDVLMQQAQAAATRLATLPPKALVASKKLLRASYMGTKEQMEREDQVFKELFNAEESKEAFKAFIEKRTPNFD